MASPLIEGPPPAPSGTCSGPNLLECHMLHAGGSRPGSADAPPVTSRSGSSALLPRASSPPPPPPFDGTVLCAGLTLGSEVGVGRL